MGSTQDPSVAHGAVDRAMHRYVETGDRVARDRALELCIPLAEHFARRYQRTDAARDDLRQTALLAVLRAADRFDPSVGVSFSTFAGRTIEGEMKRYLRDRTWMIRPPRRAGETYLAVKSAETELSQLLGRSATIAEIARHLDLDEDAVVESIAVAPVRRPLSLEAPIIDEEGVATALREAVGDEDPGYDAVTDHRVLRGLLAELTDDERTILRLHYFEGQTQQEIAPQFGVSQSYLSRKIRHTLDAMRRRAEDRPPPRRPTAAAQQLAG
jgi:RNA polymerase sigma-B factor